MSDTMKKGVIIGIIILAIAAIFGFGLSILNYQYEEEKARDEYYENLDTCFAGVFFTQNGDHKFKPLADGYCTKSGNLGECAYVDEYGVCYDENYKEIRRAELLKSGGHVELR